MRSFTVLLAKYSGDQMQTNEMGGSCSTYKGEDRRGEVHTGFWWGKKTLGIPRSTWGRNIKMDLQETEWGDRLD